MAEWLSAFEIQNYGNLFEKLTMKQIHERDGSFNIQCKLIINLPNQTPQEIISDWCVSEFDAFAFAFKKYIIFIKNKTNFQIDDSIVPSVLKIEEKELKIEQLLKHCNTELDSVYKWFKNL